MLCRGIHLTNNDHATEKDMQQAEVFDALGHPTRVVILKALIERTSQFCRVKKENRNRKQRSSFTSLKQARWLGEN